MPLKKGSSSEAMAYNFKKLNAEGSRSQAQIKAIVLRLAGKSKK
jgi:hypothetical protein